MIKFAILLLSNVFVSSAHFLKIGDDDVPDSLANCRSPFELIGGSCLLFSMVPTLTWSQARVYCQERGSDLAVIKTGNELVAAMHYLKGINVGNYGVSAWIGGSDLESANTWKWVDGTLMPRGSPFWGTTNEYKVEPGAANQHCTFMYARDGYSFHDYLCESTDLNYPSAPLCQYFL